MSNLKENEFSSKSSCSSGTTEIEESTLLRSSGYHSASDPSSSQNSTKENRTIKDVKKKGKVISSRYRQSALTATSRLRKTSDNLQLSASQLDITRSADVRRNSPLRKASRSGVSASCTEVNRSQAPGGPWTHVTNRPPVLQTPNLHSTAVNATWLDSTNAHSKAFSTTVVKSQPKRNAHTYMPDISAIQPTTPMEKLPTEQRNCLLKQDSDEESCDITQADLDLEYLQYLTWGYVDVSSEEAFQDQCADAEKQISFLTQIINEKREKITQHRKHIMLAELHDQTVKRHEELAGSLRKLIDVLPSCQTAIEEVGKSLEPKINQIKLKNIHVPEDEQKYKEEIENALLETNNLLTTIENGVTPRQNELKSINETVSCLRHKKEIISKCKQKTDKVAGFAIQEASLRLTVKDFQNK